MAGYQIIYNAAILLFFFLIEERGKMESQPERRYKESSIFWSIKLG